MRRFGNWLLVAGVVLTAVGLIAGFGLMFAGEDDAAKAFLASVPIGFLLGFTGLVTQLLSSD